jgi:hypothetical protein
MDYLSPQHIQNINFSSMSGNRRSSAFARHLQSMQSAAKKQEEMYRFFLGGKTEQCQEALV